MQLQYVDSSNDDFDILSELRIEAMRESLEAIGRFDRERSMERFRSSFVPTDTLKILSEGVLTGFYSVTNREDHLHLTHLYVRPSSQCVGIGSLAMKEIFKLSSETGLPIRLGALKESRSNRFYQKHGFVETADDEWDTYYERAANSEQVVDDQSPTRPGVDA